MNEILYGYTPIRMKLFFESSNTTSVPLGYLLSLLFCYVFNKSKFNSFIILLAEVFTISRSAILSTGVYLMFKNKKIGFIILPIVLLLVYYKTSISTGFDFSSADRIFYFIYSIELYFSTLPNNLFGFGLSPNLLYMNTGYFYYENIFSQLLMNGGLLLLLIGLGMYLSFLYKIFFKRIYIYIPVIIGNFFGGFNLFSTISLPLYFLLVYFYVSDD